MRIHFKNIKLCFPHPTAITLVRYTKVVDTIFNAALFRQFASAFLLFFLNLFLFACAFLFLKEASLFRLPPSNATTFAASDCYPESERLSSFLGRRDQSIAPSALTFCRPTERFVFSPSAWCCTLPLSAYRSKI